MRKRAVLVAAITRILYYVMAVTWKGIRRDTRLIFVLAVESKIASHRIIFCHKSEHEALSKERDNSPFHSYPFSLASKFNLACV